MWASCRHRRWCLLTSPAIGKASLVPWDADAKPLTVGHVIQRFEVSDGHLAQLCFTDYDLEQFAARHRFDDYILRPKSELPTA